MNHECQSSQMHLLWELLLAAHISTREHRQLRRLLMHALEQRLYRRAHP